MLEGGGERRGSVVALRSGELAWVEGLHENNAVKAALDDIHSWDFSIFELDRASNRHPLLMVALETIQRFELEASLPINLNNLVRPRPDLEPSWSLPRPFLDVSR